MPGPSTVSYGSVRNVFALVVPVAPGAALTASTSVQRTYTVPGLLFGFDFVISCNKPSYTAGVCIANARVSADNTLEISFGNLTAGTPSLPATENYYLVVARHDYPSLAAVPTAIA